MQRVVQNSTQTTTDNSTHLQRCLYRPTVDQEATLTENYCCSFSQAEAMEVAIPPLDIHLYCCSFPLPVLQDFSQDFFFDFCPFLLDLLHQRSLLRSSTSLIFDESRVTGCKTERKKEPQKCGGKKVIAMNCKHLGTDVATLTMGILRGESQMRTKEEIL